MKIFVLNCGSSSIKYQLFDMTKKEVLAKGGIEKVGMSGSFLKHEVNGKKVKFEIAIPDHQVGVEKVLEILTSKDNGCLNSLKEIDAVGHRVLHGGDKFTQSVLVNDDVIDQIKACIPLGPLHNPANLKGIMAVKTLLPEMPQCAIFDTAFHQTMPASSYMYAIPYEFYQEYGIRRYGFHGISHRYVSKRACQILNLDYNKTKIITCHLGNGASVSAVKDGKCFDTSMGLTPAEGLMMGTRCGDIDPAVFPFLMENKGLDMQAMKEFINKKSGVLGVSGVSSDMREVEEAEAAGNERAALALRMYDYRIKKYIGSYAAAMNGVDVIVFTGGIGENADTTRRGVATNLECLGVEFDDSLNTGLRGKEQVISKPSSRVTVIVVPTNEELVIAQDTLDIVSKL